jgi:hypothetical protein
MGRDLEPASDEVLTMSCRSDFKKATLGKLRPLS